MPYKTMDVNTSHSRLIAFNKSGPWDVIFVKGDINQLLNKHIMAGTFSNSFSGMQIVLFD